MKILPFLSLGVLTSSVYASSGDRSSEFVDCVNLCKTQQCSTNMLSLPLRVTRWTCTDDCKYQCMHQITDRDLQSGKPVQQYHGKWPFWRLAGMQEPASVAFSFLNLWAHARGASKIRRRVSDHHPMKYYYLVWSMVSINAWVWSSVFHTRGWFEYLYLRDDSHYFPRFTLDGEAGLFFSSTGNYVRLVLHHDPPLPPLPPCPIVKTYVVVKTSTILEIQALDGDMHAFLHSPRFLLIAPPSL